MRKKLYLLTTNYGIWYGKMDKYEEMLEEINKNTNNEIYKLNVQIFEKNNEIIRKNEEIDRLKKYISKLEIEYEYLRHTYPYDEIERLNNIIDELEKYLKEYSQDLEFRCYANTFLEILNKLKEGK